MCTQFQESVITRPVKAGTNYSATHQCLQDHTLSIQNLINTFPLIQSLLLPVVKQAQSLRSSTHCASPWTRHSIPLMVSERVLLLSVWKPELVLYPLLSISICFLWSWEETVSLNCIWLLQVISLKPSAGLLGPGDFFLAAFCISEKDGFIRLSVKMCFMRMDEALYPSQDIYYISYASELQSKYYCLHIIWILFMKH